MDENTVFQGQGTAGAPPQAPIPPNPAAGASGSTSYVAKPESVPPPSSFLPVSKIIKIIIGVIVVAVIGFIIFKFVVPIFSPKDTKVTLVYWGLWEDSSIMNSVIADFERENPNIDIDYKKEDPKQYQERLITRTKEEGTGPDIFRFHNTWLPILRDILIPLPTDVITRDEFQKNYYSVAQEDLISKGAIYGIPLGIDTLSLFINTEIFNASGLSPPTTWDEFLKTSRSITVKEADGKIKTAGAAIGTFDNVTHAPEIVSLLFIQNGADLDDLTATKDNASDALEFYAQFAKGDASVWDATLDNSLSAFARGDLAMYFGFSWDIFAIKALSPELTFSIASVPRLLDRNMTIASYWVEGASIKSKHKKEALLFLKFLAKKETAQKLYSEESKVRLFGEPYARKDLAETLNDNELVFPFVSQAQNAQSSFFASDTHDDGYNKKMNEYLGDAVRSVLNNTSPQTAVETLSKGVSQIFSQYGIQK